MANLDFQSVGPAFATQFYATYDSNKTALSQFFADSSMLSFQGEHFQGASAIGAKLAGMPNVKHEVITCDCQPNPPHGGILVFVGGYLIVDNNTAGKMAYSETFQLCKRPTNTYFCQNNIFRLNG